MSRSPSLTTVELADDQSASGASSVWNSNTYTLGQGHSLSRNATTTTYANTAITNNGVISGSTYPGPYTITSGTGITNPWATHVSPKIRLDGEGADIEVNGVSLMDIIGKIEQRLNILHPNQKLEAEWEELHVLGEQYRKLEQHIKDKQATWDRLKAMPKPNID